MGISLERVRKTTGEQWRKALTDTRNNDSLLCVKLCQSTDLKRQAAYLFETVEDVVGPWWGGINDNTVEFYWFGCGTEISNRYWMLTGGRRPRNGNSVQSDQLETDWKNLASHVCLETWASKSANKSIRQTVKRWGERTACWLMSEPLCKGLNKW